MIEEEVIEEEGRQGSRKAKGRAEKLAGSGGVVWRIGQSHQLFRGPRSTIPDKVAKVVPGSKRNLDIIPSATWSP